MQGLLNFPLIFCTIIFFVLYLIAPESYSWTFCTLCASLYIGNSLIGAKYIKQYGIISFSTLFISTLFLASFIFPIFIYPVDESYSLFQFGYNSKFICKCSCLVCLAQSFYWLGISNIKKARTLKLKLPKVEIYDTTTKRLSILVSLIFFYFITSGGLIYFTDRYIEGIMSRNIIVQYLLLFLTDFSVLLSCIIFLTRNKRLFYTGLIISLIICTIILSSGSRTIPLYILVVLVYGFKQKFKISNVRLLCFLGAIAFVFFAIGHIRSESFSIDDLSNYDLSNHEFGIWENFRDFIIVGRNLYSSYEYVDNHSILWGKNFLGPLLSPIPFAQSIISTLFHIPQYELGSAGFFTHQVFGSKSSFGLGTHVVADVYLASGLFGVCFLFYWLGCFIKHIEMRKTYSESYNLVYMLILSYSVFFCRGSFFGMFKIIIWSFIIIRLLNSFRYEKNSNIISIK